MIKLNKMNLIVFLVLAMLVAVSIPAFSMGKAETVPYGITLDEEFSDILAELEAGTKTLDEAIAALHDLRAANGREDGEDYRVMEQIMAGLQAGTLTRTMAMKQFYGLPESQVDCTGDQLQDRDRLRLKDGSEDGDAVVVGDQDKLQDQTRDQDKLQDGSCEDCDGDQDQLQTQTQTGGGGAGAANGKK